VQFASVHVSSGRGVLLSRSITLRYELITHCDLAGSGCLVPELFARWHKRPRPMSRDGARYCVNLEGLLARRIQRNTRVHTSCAYTGKHRSLQVNLVSPGLTGRPQWGSSAAGQQHDRRADARVLGFGNDRTNPRAGNKPTSYSDGTDRGAAWPEQAYVRRPGTSAEPRSAGSRRGMPTGPA
jgi:hypothetical protein